ncbi:solute carrier family 25 member 48 isoform X4 [Manis javanica]|uniref:solute carrier family 25 member 48 isoform X4 n=1 Tax=Manis javanica TaxID=9974 RepID=UPI003C6D0841
MPRSLGLGTHLAREGEAPRPGPAMGSFQLDDFAAGWIGGTASVIVGHPLDTVKVFGFFKGMSFPLASIAVYNSVVFGVFSNTQRFLSQHHGREPEASPPRTLPDLLLASMVAGVVSVGLGAPMDLIKIRLQMQTQPFRAANLSLKPRVAAHGEQPAYQGPVHCIATIVRTDGLVGLYRGTSAMLLRDVPGYCLYFIPYVFLSEWITPEACASPSPCAAWLAGGMAGAISWGTATPMDVVKSRLQADGVHLNKYKGVLDCIYQSYQNEGLKGQSQQSKASVYWPQVAAEGSFSRCRCSESPGERRPPATPAVRLVGGALSPLAGPGIPSPPAARALLLSWPLGRRAGRTQRITIRFRSAPAPGETAPAPAHCKLAGRSRRGWGCLQSFQIKTSKTASAPFGIRCFRLDSRKHWPPSLFPLCRPLQLLLA